MFDDYLLSHFGVSLPGNNYPVSVMADDRAIYLVTMETPSTMCAGFNCYTSGKNAAHLLILPNNLQPDASELYDVNGDHLVTPVDVLIVINAINDSSGGSLFSRPELRMAYPKIDVNGDGELSPIDAMRVIDWINGHAPVTASSADAVGEGESQAVEVPNDLMALAADDMCRELAAKRRR